MSKPRVQTVSRITLSGAIKLCTAIGQSESDRADDFIQIAKWLKECQEYKSILNNSAYAEIKTGKWIKIGNTSVHKCDVCEEAVNEPSQFCPHCGSFIKKFKAT